jgi:hypothetical protein
VATTFKDGKEGLRLVESRSYQTGKYICLSHCWGKAAIETCTTKKPLREANGSLWIAFDRLPRNFQDAVSITRKLGVEFIWIDSICIIQDDSRDWAIESAKMADVYKNAYLTIAAVWSPDSTGGCFSTTRPDICFSVPCSDGSSYLLGARTCDTKGILKNTTEIQKRFPLFTRAWVFQERLMSRRILYCNYGELAFQCFGMQTCECRSPTSAPHARRESAATGQVEGMFRFLTGVNSGLNQGSSSETWRRMVVHYAALDLTFQKDILPAISGCAKVIAEATSNEYIAGMWQQTLHQDLLWYNTLGANKKPKYRSKDWTAPSWSWASMPAGSAIQFIGLVSPQMASHPNFLRDNIRHASCDITSPNNVFGQISSARIQLKTAAFPCFIRRYCFKKKSVSRKLSGRKYDLHHPRSGYKDVCKTEDPGLETYNGLVEFLPDTVLGNEGLDFTLINDCVDRAEDRCGIASIHLIRLVQKVVNGDCTDYFMMLRKADTSSESYARLGLVTLGLHKISQREFWFKDVWDRHVSAKKLITLI